jgi:hypothetical protein
MERMVKAAMALIRSTSAGWLPGLARFPAARAGALEMTPILEISMSHGRNARENLSGDGCARAPAISPIQFLYG